MVLLTQRSKRTSGYYRAKIKSREIENLNVINNYSKNINGKNNNYNRHNLYKWDSLLWPLIFILLQIVITTAKNVNAFPSNDIEYEIENEAANARLRHIGDLSKIESLHHRRFRSTSSSSSSSFDSSLPLSDSNNNKGGGKGSSSAALSAYIDEDTSPVRIHGYRIEESDKEPEIGPIPKVLSRTKVVLRLFGEGITEKTVIAFTKTGDEYGKTCVVVAAGPFPIVNGSHTSTTGLFEISLSQAENELYICAKNDDDIIDSRISHVKPFRHQGSEEWLRLSSNEPLLPMWASIVIIVVCLAFSALFSGLNLGLMSIDRTELKILRNTGTEKERKFAAKIQPVRDHGNYLLCSILLGNVLVNSTFTILLDGLTSGLIAVIFSTIAIVLFGEITPQAVCSRHGLAVGARTIYITKAVMLITFPLSYPISKILDYILGEEIGNVYNRERLKELVRVTTGINDLDKDEVNIISGALELRKKKVSEVMTHIEDAFMLSLDSILDFETVSEIMKSGFSRIPVYDNDRKNIVTLLYIKDLAFVDPDDNTPLKTLCEFYQNPCHFIFEDTTLDIMFKQFKSGQIGHMAFVHRVNNEGEGDPFYETIGLVTLEDVIEELIQAEIVDETDVFTDNRTKVKRQKIKRQDFTIFAERKDNQRIRISPQLTLATFQYLSTTIDAFKTDTVSETILRRLLNQDIVHHIKCKGKDKDDPTIYIYQQGKPVDYFALILEGRVEVTVGRESLVFESGPFTFFGIQALVQNVGIDSPNQAQPMGSLQSLNMDAMLRHTFIPDYSVRAVTDVIYMSVKRNLYLAAKRATLLERAQRVPGGSETDVIDDEVEKLLHSLDEDDRVHIHSHNNQHITKYLNKTGSNTPSPTFKSVSIDSIRRKSQKGIKNDRVLFVKEIVPNGPTPISPNSNATSFNQQSSLMSSQASNSLLPTPNLTSPTTGPPHPSSIIGGGGGGVIVGGSGDGIVSGVVSVGGGVVNGNAAVTNGDNIQSPITLTTTTTNNNTGTSSNIKDDHAGTPLLSDSKS